MLTPEEIQHYQQIASAAPSADFPPALLRPLLLKGLVITLLQDGSAPAINLLQQLHCASELETIRQMALDALDELTAQGNALACEMLYTLAIEHESTAAQVCLLERGYPALTLSRQLLFELLTQRPTEILRRDPQLTRLTEAYFDAQSAPLRPRLLVNAHKSGLEHWASIVSAVEQLQAEALNNLVRLYPVFKDNERQLAIHLLAQAAQAGSPAAQETLCQMVIQFQDPTARTHTLQYAYAPAQAEERAAFYFLSEQWEKYENLDFNHALLDTVYATAGEELRQRLLAHSRQTGQVQWLQTSGAIRQVRWLRDLTDADWQTAIQHLAALQRWEDLWRLAQLASPIFSAQILLALAHQDWRPTVPEEQEAFNDLAKQATECTRELPEIHHVKDLSSPTGSITCLALHPAGNLLASGSSDTAIPLWRFPDGKLKGTGLSSPAAQTRLLTFSADGEYLVAASGDSHIHIFRLADGKVVKSIAGHTGMLRGLVLHPDDRTLYSAGFDGTLRSWRFPLGAELKKIQQGAGEIFSLAVSPEGDYLLSAGSDRNVHVYRLPDGEHLRQLEGHTNTVLALAVAPTGSQQTASAGRDGSIRLWHHPSGKLLHQITTTDSPITSLSFHPNKQVLLGGAYNGDLALWNTSTGKQLVLHHGHNSPITGLAIDALGHTLACAHADGRLALWYLRDFLLLHLPLDLATPGQADQIEQQLKTTRLNLSQQRWLNLALHLLRWKQRYDVELADSRPISIGEFDIQI